MYRQRLVDTELVARLQRVGAVLIEGPKACGKTSTGRRHAASEVILDVSYATLPIQLALEGERPRLIDEWQIVPSIWNLIRHEVDKAPAKGQFILTGSARPADDVTRHSGAGRFSRLRMRTMSMVESGHSTGTISLSHLASGNSIDSIPGSDDMDILLDALCRGGWPMNLDLSRSDGMLSVRDYVEEVSRGDVILVSDRQRKRDPRKVRSLLTSLARSVGAPLSANTIAKDIVHHGTAMSDDTVREYLDALDAVMLIDRIPAWTPHIRSRASIRSQRKVYLADPSLALAVLNVQEHQIFNDLGFLGIVFENLVIRDLLVYAQHMDAQVSYYRDSNGLEVDAILEYPNGTWSAIEIKLSPRAIDIAAATLLKFSENINTEKNGAPSSLIIITGSGPAYRRDDGIYVVPITMLGS